MKAFSIFVFAVSTLCSGSFCKAEDRVHTGLAQIQTAFRNHPFLQKCVEKYLNNPGDLLLKLGARVSTLEEHISEFRDRFDYSLEAVLTIEDPVAGQALAKHRLVCGNFTDFSKH